MDMDIRILDCELRARIWILAGLFEGFHPISADLCRRLYVRVTKYLEGISLAHPLIIDKYAHRLF